ncbi:hypothetical protein [Candidatus Nitrosocosmicus hydrocola]|nr:hypothetical protein [Candidatus Nitrosocosmicus hydrocola]
MKNTFTIDYLNLSKEISIALRVSKSQDFTFTIAMTVPLKLFRRG